MANNTSTIIQSVQTGGTPSILIALLAGVAAGILVLVLQWAGQRVLDRWVEWPFEVDMCGLAPNPTVPRREARVRVFNRTSRVARVMATPLDNGGKAINGWDVSDAFTGESPRGFIPIAARSWIEFRVDSPLTNDGSEPQFIKLEAAFFTLERIRIKTYPVEYSHEFR